MRKPSAVVVLVLLLTVWSHSKDKKKDVLPVLILRARHVAVIVDPDAGMSITNPTENGVAQGDVEAALRKWDRFKVTSDTANADLILVVRKGGKTVKPTIGGGNRNDRPVILDPGGNGDVNIGISAGRRP